VRIISLVSAIAALATLAACSTAPTFNTQKNWTADGAGHYVNAESGRVISEAQYTEILAVEVRNRVGARIAAAPQYCPTPKR